MLQRLDTIDLVFDLPGPDVVTFSNSENVTTLAMFDAIPDQEFEARLVEFSTQADPTTQTFRTRVAIDRPLDATILPGMVGTITVSAASSAHVEFSIPMTALAGNAEGETFVWLVNAPDNTLARQPVVTGEASGQSVVVESGLKAGDVIVVAGLSRLQPDMVVRPISEIGQ